MEGAKTRRTVEELLAARGHLGSLGALDFLIDLEQRGEPRRPSNLGGGASDIQAGHENPPLVSVVMTAYNSAKTIGGSIRSVLGQTLSNIELIVVDDCSSDSTVDIVEAVSGVDSRVRLLRCYENRGTYWAKNLGLMHARGAYIALHDSDDESNPSRLRKQVDALEQSSAYLCYTNWVRTDSKGEPVENRGLIERLGYPTAMFRRKLIDEVGFYDSVRIAADDEFHKRVKIELGSGSIFHLKEALYRAPLGEGSLTGRNPVMMTLSDERNPMSFLSETRQEYVRCYERWHNSGDRLYMPFPLRERLFDAPSDICVSAFEPCERIVASVASIPRRREGLERVVRNVVAKVDSLRVHLNHYDGVPSFLDHPKITVTRSQELGDLRDNGKFRKADDLDNDFHLTLDDDLYYPSHYVPYMVAKVLQYGRAAVVGLHGTIINRNFARYHDPKSRTTHSFRLPIVEDKCVHVLGTGTTAYHTRNIRFSDAHAKTTGMVDLWLARYAAVHNIPLVCVSRGYGWLNEMDDLPDGSLYKEFVENDARQTDLILKERLWDRSLPACSECL